MFELGEQHKMVAQMVRDGQITREEARNHGSRNVISRALGTKSKVSVGVWPAAFHARPGDRLLLCSDGIHDPMDDQEILCLMAGKRPNAAAAALLADNSNPSEDEIRHGIEGNLCRCTGYHNIVRAVEYAGAKMRGEEPAAPDWEEAR